MARPVVIALALTLAAYVGFAPSPALLDPAYVQPAAWKAILIAGDDAEPAFDNAVDAMLEKLKDFGVPTENIVVLKSDGRGAMAATRLNVEYAFAHVAPGAREGCFVFITSHGVEHEGLVMTRARATMKPITLSQLLDASCGDRPTVVIASGCFSGGFAEVDGMRGDNRVILTAARADRPSFGCNAGLEYTIFDRCALENLIKGLAWAVVMNRARGCVAAEERKLDVTPSEPQLFVGAGVQDLRVFSR